MKVLHLSAFDTQGGAARAGFRIHSSLLKHSYKSGDLLTSHMLVNTKLSSDHTVTQYGQSTYRRTRKILQRLSNKYYQRLYDARGYSFSSAARFGNGLPGMLGNLYKQKEFDILNLHWLGDVTLSIAEISQLRVPCLWTLHDPWTLFGAEHYDSSLLPTTTNLLKHRHEQLMQLPDLNRKVISNKLKSWSRPITLICPSRWIMDLARESPITNNWPAFHIPYPIDSDYWAPVSREYSRKLLGISEETRIILFGADGGTKDPRKGGDLFLRALSILGTKPISDDTSTDPIKVIIFGEHKERLKEKNIEIQYVGALHDDLSLKIYYSASDVMVVPSRMDNLPLAAMEAQSMGIPVVAFRTGGLPDIVLDGKTGFLAHQISAESLAESIYKSICSLDRNREMGYQATLRARSLWSYEAISGQYRTLYESVLAQSNHFL